MSEYRSELLQQLEDATLAVMMDDYAESVGRADVEIYNEELAQGNVPEITDNELRDRCQQFLQRLDGQDEEQKSGSVKWRKAASRIVSIAATIAIFFSLLLAVQAAGVDVFGSIGRWTDKVLHLGNRNLEEAVVEKPEFTPSDEIRLALIEQDIPPEFAPMWLPEGYTIIELEKDANAKESFVIATLENTEKLQVSIRIGKFLVGTSGYENYVEKDKGDITVSIVGDKQYSVFFNNGVLVAVWQSEMFSISIIGCNRLDDLQNILNSIGEQYYE